MFRKRSSLNNAISIVVMSVVVAGRILAAGSSPQLVVDAGGHTSPVWSVSFIDGGKELLSVGQDKCVRCWDTSDGHLLNTLWVEHGQGPIGSLLTGAIDNDGSLLVIGGHLVDPASANATENSATTSLVVIDTKTFSVVQSLNGAHGNVASVAFSPTDPTKVIAVSGNSVFLWDRSKTGDPTRQAGDNNILIACTFSPDGKKIAALSQAGDLFIWDTGNFSDQSKFPVKTTIGKDPSALAWSAKGVIAIGAGKGVSFVDPAKSSVTHGPTFSSSVTRVAFSSTGDKLLVGLTDLGGDKAVGSVVVHDMSAGTDSTPYSGNNGYVSALAFDPSGTSFASAGGLSNQILLESLTAGSTPTVISSPGGAIQSVKWITSPNDPHLLYWTAYDSQKDHAVARYFDLDKCSLLTDTPSAEQLAATSVGAGSVVIDEDQEGVEVGDGANRSHFLLKGLNLEWWDKILSAVALTNGEFAVGTSAALNIYDKTGSLKQELVSHTGDVYALAVSSDSNYLASASGDQTVAIWPLNSSESPLSPREVLFVTSERNWVAWSPSGYYDCSSDGQSLIAWLQNQGLDKSAAVQPASAYESQYFKPAYVDQLISNPGFTPAKLDVAAPIVEYLAPQKADIPASGNGAATVQVPVKISITDPANLELSNYSLLDNGNPITPTDAQYDAASHIWNGTISLAAGEHKLSFSVTNSAQVEGHMDKPVTLLYDPAGVLDENGVPKGTKRTLYILSIGISSYEPPVDPIPGADNDAQLVYDTFKKQEGVLFSKVVSINPWTDVSKTPASDATHAGPLLDFDATGDNITASLSNLSHLQGVLPSDILVVFIAGHGVTYPPSSPTAEYFFLPSNADSRENLDRWAERWDDLQKAILQVPCKRILIMDTCHAGDANLEHDQNDMFAQALDSAFKQGSFGADPLLTLSSCAPDEVSGPAKNGNNGLFTFWLAQGLSGGAPHDENGYITGRLLNKYVHEHVLEDSGNKQTPPLLPDDSLLADVPLAKGAQ
jgi:WD40 repeat protein